MKINFLPKITVLRLRNILLFLIFFIAVFSSGFFLGAKQVKNNNPIENAVIDRGLPENKDVNFDLFWQVWDMLEASYFDKSKVVYSEMIYGAVKGMVSSLGDPYTAFLTPGENKVVKEDLQGNFEGIGIEIGYRGNQLAVISPIPGSPAEKAGIKAGDFIIGIKDENKNIDKSTSGITLPQAVQDIRGPAGSKVTLAILREGREDALVVDVIRESINIPSVVLEYVGDDKEMAHVKLYKFGGETSAEWDEAVYEIQKNKNTKAIILDVRNNGGGYLQAAVYIASDFLENGDTVVIEEDATGQTKEFKNEKIARLERYPVFVLINNGSASASEILAGALKDQLGATLVGQTTFGKGTIQEPISIEDGSGLHVTVARWLTPNKFWVNETGLDPDVTIEDNLETQEDEVLTETLKLIINEI